MKQFLWFNKNIVVDCKPIFIEAMYKKSIKYINDLLSEEGQFLQLNTLNDTFGTNLTVMQYNSIKSAIPKEWKRLLKSVNNRLQIEDDENKNIRITINKIPKGVFDISNKDIYWELIGRVVQKPTAITKWEEKYDLFEFDWKNIFSIPFCVARDSTLQSFQYQILNRFFPCNEILNKWYSTHTSKCITCNMIDTIEHYFFKCDSVQLFWKQFMQWFSQATDTKFSLSALDVIFGVVNVNNLDIIDILNFCTLLAKYFIHNLKVAEKNVEFYPYQIERKNIYLEMHAGKYYGKF